MTPKAALAGRFVTKYDPDTALLIVERIANGETLAQICKSSPGLPGPATFRRWASNNPDLSLALLAAYTVSAASLEEEAIDAARAIAVLPKDGVHVQAAKVKLEQLRWSAERRDPAKYGARSSVNVRVPIQINTSLDLGSGTSGGASAGIYTIEAKAPAPLVTEEPLSRGGKRILTPPGGPRPRVAFGKLMRGNTDGNDVRPEGDKPSDREGGEGSGPGPGDQGVHGPGEDGGTLPQEPPQHGEETPEGRDREALDGAKV